MTRGEFLPTTLHKRHSLSFAKDQLPRGTEEELLEPWAEERAARLPDPSSPVKERDNSEVQSIVMEVKVNHFRMLLRQSKSETGKMRAHLFAPPSTRPRLGGKGCPLRRDTRTWTFTIHLQHFLTFSCYPYELKISWSTVGESM